MGIGASHLFLHLLTFDFTLNLFTMAKLPEYNVLNFCFDNDHGCSLTILAHDVRFHITVNPEHFQDRSKKGKEVQRTYRRLLQQAKAVEQGSEGDETVDSSEDETEDEEECETERDSAVDVSTPELDEETNAKDNTSEPTRALHKWILMPLSKHLPSSTSQSRMNLYDWYHNPIHYYTLTTSSGKLQAEEDKSPAKLMTGRLKDFLIPTVSLPKKTLDLSVPQISASDLIALSCATDPAPYHPILVSHKDETYFLKPVDPSQPGPTIREIHSLHSIAEKGLHDREDFRCPELRALVHFSSDSPSNSPSEKKHITALLLTPIPSPTPLTLMLDSSVAEEKRTQWANDAARMVEVLHENDLVWGDAKGDNFLVDGEEEKVWMIDFGGSYTEGWVDEKIKETEEGDWMGTEKVVNALEDPVNGTADENDEDVGDAEEDGDEVEGEQEAEQGEEAEEEAVAAVGGEQDADEADEGTVSNFGEDDSTSKEPTNATPPSRSSGRKRSRTEDADDEDDEVHHSKQRKTSRHTSGSDTTEDVAYCFCNSASSGRMLACDGKNCKRQWFHFECLGIEEAPKESTWFCDECS